MTPGAIGVAKTGPERGPRDDLRALARRVLRLPTVDEIEQALLEAISGSVRSARGAPTRVDV